MGGTQRVASTGRLTEVAIRAWLRKSSPVTLHDGGGLYLRRRADGAFWSLRQVNPLSGRRTWAALFPDVAYPLATLADARRKATEARMRALDGPTDLVRERQGRLAAKRAEADQADLEARRQISLRTLFDRWSATELKSRIGTDGRRVGRKDDGKYAREQFERRVFPRLGEVAARGVTKGDLLSILDATKAEGKLRTANVLLANLKQMFRFALVREVVDRNPLDTVTKRDVGGADTARERVLSASEITELAEAIPSANLGKRTVAAIWLVLATGCRVGEAMGARWEHVKLQDELWHLPTTKNERDHNIHLSRFAIRQFEALFSLRGVRVDDDGQEVQVAWVFPNAAGDGPVDVKSFGKQLADRQRDAAKRIQRRAKRTASLELSGGRWTAHDLRRTAATLMANLGVSGDVIDECLNHVIESRVRRTYVRDRREGEQAKAFDALGEVLDGLATGQSATTLAKVKNVKSSNVIAPNARSEIR